MLPDNCTAFTAVTNFDRTLGVMVANTRGDMRTYEFGWIGRNANNDGRQGPPFTREALFAIADEWETGIPRVAAYRPSEPREVPAAPYMRTKDAFTDWVKTAKKGDTAVYFTGSIVHFRDEAPRRMVELQRLADQAPVKKPRPAVERLELARLQATRELLTQVDLFYRKDLITLGQRRDLGGIGTSYLAIRKGNRMTQSHPYLEQKLQKEMSGAIRGNWAKHAAKNFQILAITYDGSSDNTHETTAIVRIYKGNAQNTLDVRIPYRDLGENRARWPFILKLRGDKAAKQLSMRVGRADAIRASGNKSSLDDM